MKILKEICTLIRSIDWLTVLQTERYLAEISHIKLDASHISSYLGNTKGVENVCDCVLPVPAKVFFERLIVRFAFFIREEEV